MAGAVSEPGTVQSPRVTPRRARGLRRTAVAMVTETPRQRREDVPGSPHEVKTPKNSQNTEDQPLAGKAPRGVIGDEIGARRGAGTHWTSSDERPP